MSKSSPVNAYSGFDTGITDQYVVFFLDDQRYALPLIAVERIVRAVEVTPLPKAPDIVLGAIDVEGHVIPVINLRRRLLLHEQGITPANQFLIANTAQRRIVLVIDEAQGVIEREQSAIINTGHIVAGLEQFQGIARLDDGLVLIHDLEKLLSLDEARALDKAMEQA